MREIYEVIKIWSALDDVPTTTEKKKKKSSHQLVCYQEDRLE